MTHFETTFSYVCFGVVFLFFIAFVKDCVDTVGKMLDENEKKEVKK